MTVDRIRTTHTGSLPRPETVLRLLTEQEAGRPVDPAAIDAALTRSIAECVDKQIAVGIDVVSDGEFSKPSYSTYVKDRLTGFGEEGQFPMPADLADYPEYSKRVFGEEALATLKTPRCSGPVKYGSGKAVQRDIERFRSALRGRKQGFLTAASPGVIALFLRNHHYATEAAYLSALADAMRTEYRTIHEAGFMLQIDAPDLAMGAHMQWAGVGLKDLRHHLAASVEALDHAVADIPADRMRLHVCWGNYEGPHHRDVALKDIVDIVLSARPGAVSFVAANPRHEHESKSGRRSGSPRTRCSSPGSSTPLPTSSSIRSSSPSASCASPGSLARTASSRAPTAASPRLRGCTSSSHPSRGRSSSRSRRALASRHARSAKWRVAIRRARESACLQSGRQWPEFERARGRVEGADGAGRG